MIRSLILGAALIALTACTPTPATSTPTPASDTPTGVATTEGALTAAAPAGTCRAVDGKADRKCTPGATNPTVTQFNIAQTICKSGWTKTVRPPVSYTNDLKRKQMAQYGVAGPPSGVEEDHLVALELGGNPTDPANLWPQLRTGPHPAAEKDSAENALHRAVCNGRVTLAEAQRQIVDKWTHA